MDLHGKTNPAGLSVSVCILIFPYIRARGWGYFSQILRSLSAFLLLHGIRA